MHTVLDYVEYTSELSRMRARIRITDIVGGATAMSFGKKKFAPRWLLAAHCCVATGQVAVGRSLLCGKVAVGCSLLCGKVAVGRSLLCGQVAVGRSLLCVFDFSDDIFRSYVVI